jgi:hypothetical protein
MDALPPPPEAQARLANWRTSPFNRWAFHRVREILPSTDIAHDPGNVRELPLEPADQSLGTSISPLCRLGPLICQ